MGGGKREPVGMAKAFDFQMPVVYVTFRLTIQLLFMLQAH